MAPVDPQWQPYQDENPNISAYVHWLQSRQSQAGPGSQFLADMQSVSRADALAVHFLGGASEPDAYVVRAMSLHDDDMRRSIATRHGLLGNADSNTLIRTDDHLGATGRQTARGAGYPGDRGGDRH